MHFISFHWRLYKRNKYIASVIPERQRNVLHAWSNHIYLSQCAQTAEQITVECFKLMACVSCENVRGIIRSYLYTH